MRVNIRKKVNKFWLKWFHKSLEKSSFLHIGGGGLAVVSYGVHWVFPPVSTWLFYQYEKHEEKSIGDKAFRDIQEFMFGAFLALMILRVGVLFGIC